MREAERARGVIVTLPDGTKLTWPIVCVDFDGVLAEYHGYQTMHEQFPPLKGTGGRNLLYCLHHYEYTVVIHSARPKAEIEAWRARHDLAEFVSLVTSEKVPAVAYVDDRAVRFHPSMSTSEILDAIKEPAHWERTP